MKTIKSTIIVIILSTILMQTTTVFALDYTCPDGEVVIDYRPYKDKGIALVEGFSKISENIVIPEKIDGLKVTGYDHVINHETNIIKTITLPKTIKKVSRDEADLFFSEEQVLEELIIDTKNPIYGCKNNLFYNKKTGCALEYIGNAELGKYTIPKHIKKIGMWAFSGKTITHLTVGKNVTEIGHGAFCLNKNLEFVVIKGNVKVLSTGAFGSCDKLKNINLNKGLKIIRSGALNECTSLKKIKIPNSATKIEKRAFVGCTNLKKVFVSKKTKIEKNAFPKTCKIVRK